MCPVFIQWVTYIHGSSRYSHHREEEGEEEGEEEREREEGREGIQ